MDLDWGIVSQDLRSKDVGKLTFNLITMAETESWPPNIHSLFLLWYMLFQLCIWPPTKECISQALLQLVLTLWLGSGQWDDSKSDTYNHFFLTLEGRNIGSSSYFLPEDWNGFPFSHVDQTLWRAEHQWKSLYPWIHSGTLPALDQEK